MINEAISLYEGSVPEAVYNELLISFWVVMITFVVVILIMSITYSYYKVAFRKREHIYCKQILKHESKLTEEEIKYLRSIEPKLDRYAHRWWYNNGFAFISRYRKMRKITKKYNLEINVWNED